MFMTNNQQKHPVISNEDRLKRISQSIFVTNFPESTTSRDLWKECSVFGTVVDVFIPFKKSQAGKRFAFVRFVKVFNLERLVKNLCTIWIGRYHLYANKVRFERPNKPAGFPSNSKNMDVNKGHSTNGFKVGNKSDGSYAHVVNGGFPSVSPATLICPSPALVLDETCLIDRDFSKCVMGKVKDVNSIPNIQIILHDEGFVDVKPKYLGGLWVMLECEKEESIVSLTSHIGVHSWFQTTQEVDQDFVSEERIAWVDIEGVPIRAWSVETFSRIGKNGETECSSDDESIQSVAETIFGSNSVSDKRHSEEPVTQESGDPFKILELLNKNKSCVEPQVPSPYISHPPGFSPVGHESKLDKVHENEEVNKGPGVDSLVQNEAEFVKSPQFVRMEGSSGSVGQSVESKGGSVLGVLEEVIRVGQAMGFSMEGCEKDIQNIIGKQGDDLETKMDTMSHMDVKFMWGNSNYDFVCSDSLGSSGGILCIWESSIFKKDNVTISDNFVAIYGTWLTNNVKVLLISIYAPQQPTYKRVLWEYLSVLLGRWNDDVIIMGDFNEVRRKEERRGSVFNQSGARFFNQFIKSSGLVDVKIEGFSFTWSHPSATKMSKLDRFLVSDGIILSFPSITALCLDRHLSDHRPILLREILLDFGPTPFWFYHSWFSYDGFDEMVEKTWRSFSYFDTNRMIRFKKKLQDLKSSIRLWVKDKRANLSSLKRLDLKGQLHDINDKEVSDRFQKSKVRWAIEGDENSSFFHGIINKKRSQLAIRGILVDGSWQFDPQVVKEVFRNHFAARFKKPNSSGPKINYSFPKRLSQEQVLDLEREVSRDEIRLMVWSCGDNKSPGPDGYTFEFFKKYWSLIGCVYKVVTKILAKRFSMVISNIVSNTQSAFVSERHILDGPFIINELLHWCKRKNKRAMFFKVDFAKAVVEVGIFKGIRLNSSLSLSHLFYADNALIIGEWSSDNLRGIINVLKCFFLASGLQINFHKSQLLGVGVARPEIELAASSIGFSIMENQFRYLGVTTTWKKITWVTWDKVLALKKNGGLGVSSYFALNRALLFKWIWRFVSQDDLLWFHVMQALYGPNIDSHSVHYSLNWCSILKEMQMLKAKGFDFLSLCNKRVGDGNNTSFWLDTWRGDSALRDSFPFMFALEMEKNCMVATKMATPVDASFRRSVRGGIELVQLNELRAILDSVSLSHSHDRCICNASSGGSFRVKDIQNLIDDLILPSGSVQAKWMKWWDIDWQSWYSFHTWDGWFSSIKIAPNNKKILEGVFYVAWWSIWVFRNRLLFDDKIPVRLMIFDDIVSLSYLWCKNRCK
uniref:RNA-directed DNA polymerase, eukaryota n=1 Tax=Tanacetum cinerariifolium TaxID=118510 RepID=A0A6L2KLQ5_TANCI|nr:RNA-directed DNA polymerase, eukaryota [Tanacetum cinerariifolium]